MKFSKTVILAMVAAVVLLVSSLAEDAHAQSPRAVLRTPVVIPVSIGTPPYSTEVLWRALSAGDPTPERERIEYAGSSCQTTEHFLQREIRWYGECYALFLAPWLIIEPGTPDSAILSRAVLAADTQRWIYGGKDDSSQVAALVVAIVGRRGSPQRIPLDYVARRPGDSAVVHQVVLISLPRDSSALREELLVAALPAVLALPDDVLFRGRDGQWHLDAEIGARISDDPVEALPLDSTLTIPTGFDECGDLTCVAASPVYGWTSPPAGDAERWIVEAIYGEGLRIERRSVDGGTRSRDQARPVGRRQRWQLRPGDGITTVGSRHLRASVRWAGEVAFVRFTCLGRCR